MNRFIRPHDRWIFSLSLIGAVLLGVSWHISNLALQLLGFVVLIFTARLVNERYGFWRTVLHFNIYFTISGLMFVFL